MSNTPNPQSCRLNYLPFHENLRDSFNETNVNVTFENDCNEKNEIPLGKASLIAEILQQAKDMIQIVNNRVQGSTNLTEWDYKTIKERYIKPHFVAAKTDIYEDKTNEDIKKIHKSSDFICELLNVTGKEMYKYGTFDSLTKVLKNMKDMKMDEYETLFPVWEIVQDPNVLGKELEKTQHEIVSLRSNFDEEYTDERILTNIKKKYVTQWQDARLEQCLRSIKLQEEDLVKHIQEQELILDDETHIHSGIKLFLTEAIRDAEAETKIWQEKYEKDFERKFIDIRLLKEKREELSEYYDKLQCDYYDREYEIEELSSWLDERRQIERKREEGLEEMKVQALFEIRQIEQETLERKKKKTKKGRKGKKKRASA